MQLNADSKQNKKKTCGCGNLTTCGQSRKNMLALIKTWFYQGKTIISWVKPQCHPFVPGSLGLI